MKDKVLQTVSDVMGVPLDQLDESSTPDTVAAWDSLKHMNLVLALEEQFDVQFSDEKIVEMLSVGAIVRTLEEMTG